MLVQDIMNTRVVYAVQSDTAARAARLFSRYNIGSVPVLGENGRLRGIVTDRDVALRCIAADTDPEHTPLREVMSRCVVTAAPEDEVETAAQKMSVSQVRRLPVVKNGRLVGMLSISDLAKAPGCSALSADALSEITSNIHRLSQDSLPHRPK